MKTLLIDALYINQGGGKVLLDYLIEELERRGHSVHYLLDERIKENHARIENNKVFYVKSSIQNRYNYYKKYGHGYHKVLCFASLPPFLRLKATVYTYFHQALYLNVPQNTGFKLRLLSNIKSVVSRFFKQNTDFWWVQTSLIKEQLKNKYQLKDSNIKVLPFYPQVKTDIEEARKKNKFTYVSLPASYKNHERLIDAFVKFYNKNNSGELHLTVTEDFPILLDKIENCKTLAVPIVNHGFLNKAELVKLYRSSEYVIFPSLAESFGLGIIEAIENGCKIIGADLPYMKAVCKPSLAFDPYSEQDIEKAFEQASATTLSQSEQLLTNEINNVIHLLSEQ